MYRDATVESARHRPRHPAITSPAYMVIMRVQVSATTPAVIGDQHQRRPDFRSDPAAVQEICACTVTSRAVVGSSAINNCGPQISAAAIITRWRIPPES